MKPRHTLLHVEDDASLAFLFRRVLERAGYNYQCVPNVELAMAYVQNGSPYEDLQKFPHPDAVITDLKLCGGRSAVELIEWLRGQSRYLQTPIVVLSGGGDQASAERALQAGANAFLLKGMNVRDLVEQLEQSFRAHGLI
jgi:DNA-binding response OmpR family regulator